MQSAYAKLMLLALLVSTCCINIYTYSSVDWLETAFAASPGKYQTESPLTLTQIINLVKNQTPDSAVAIEIVQRGISFRITPNVLNKLRALGAGARTIHSLEAKLNIRVGSNGALPRRVERKSPSLSNLGSDKITILVADFNGLDDQKYGVTETIIDQLRVATKEYSDIQIKALGEFISAQQGPEVARVKGKSHKANIVLWGWYVKTQEKVNVNAHFEVLHAPHGLDLRREKESFILALSELESFNIQTRLSSEMTYLTLLTIGLARMEALDFDGAIARFITALTQPIIPDQIIEPSHIYFHRGSAYFLKTLSNFSADLREAISDFSKSIDIKPDYAKAYLLRGYSYFLDNQTDKGMNDCNKAIELDPNSAFGYFARGRLFMQEEKLDLAKLDFAKADEILGRDEKDEFSALASLFLAFVTGKNDVALAKANNLIRVSTDENILFQFYLLRGSIHVAKNSFNLAILDFDQAIKIKPKVHIGYYLRGMAYAEQKNYDKALSEIDISLRLANRFSIPPLFELYSERADIYFKKGDYNKSIADYNQVLMLNPKYDETYYNRARAYFIIGRADDALSDLNKFISLRPNDKDGYYWRASTFNLKGETDKAFSDYDEAIRLSPNDAYIFYSRGLAHQLKGNLDPAIADYNQAIKLGMTYAAIYRNRGDIYKRKGNLDDAIADYDQTIKLDPTDGAAYRGRGEINEKKGNLEYAIADYSQAIKLGSNSAAVYLDRGLIYEKKGDYEKALSDYNQSLVSDPGYIRGYLSRGMLYLKRNDYALATSDLRKVAKLTTDPDTRQTVEKVLRELGLK
jgi:tetratricopeptide (TPR) repeat protein